MTSTVGMPRETWLEFRQPLTHVREFMDQKLRVDVSGSAFTREAFWNPENRSTIYLMLKEFFTTQAWKDFVFPCLGASEVATIMGLNPYKSSIELYFEKIGAKQVYDNDNVAMFWGRELEEQIAEKWQYWDGTPEGLIENFKNKNILRRCRRLNYYVRNREFPWLFVSLDRVINKQKNGQEEVDEGSLECKTISGWSSDMWESGIPVMYVAQLQAQLIACGFSYGEIAILKDGRYFEVYPFDRSENICAKIIDLSKNFFTLVKLGIEQFLLHTYGPTDYEMQEHYAGCEKFAPEPDGSEAYKNYLSEKYTTAQETGIQGGINEVVLARTYKFYGERIKDYEKEQTECANRLKAFMKEASKIDLGADGSVTWNNNSHGTRTLRVNVKVDPAFTPEKFLANNAAVSIQTKALEHTNQEKPFASDGKKRKKKNVEESNRGE